MLIPEFEALGFDVEWIEQDHVDRAGHLFARREGGEEILWEQKKSGL